MVSSINDVYELRVLFCLGHNSHPILELVQKNPPRCCTDTTFSQNNYSLQENFVPIMIQNYKT